jgi:hypothetical protein
MKELYLEITLKEQPHKFMFYNNRGHNSYLKSILLNLASELNYSLFANFNRVLHNRKNIELTCSILWVFFLFFFILVKKKDYLLTIDIIGVTPMEIYNDHLFGKN